MSAATIFYDCDTGIDDSLALLYLLAQPALTIVGVASTGGNVPTDVVAGNNLAWLEFAGRDDVPVHVGAASPLAVPLRTCEDTHGPLGLGYAELPSPTTIASHIDAADAWLAAADAYPGELVGLVTGPLTSLAEAIRRDPTLPTKLRRLVIMGGAFHVHGNTTPVGEWNIIVDPEAAAEVFEAFSDDDAPNPIVCALDITESMIFTPDHLVRLAAAADSTPLELPDVDDERGMRSVASNHLVRHLVDALRFYFEFHSDMNEGYLAHAHDPLAAMVAVNPTLVTTTPARVSVELTGTHTRGMTVADERGMTGAPNAAIVSSADADALLDKLIETLSSFARRLS
ncbi:nucleoside hydrolase [Gordonia sp. CPCC 205333]|uniref:nucleoside hydrolase n=1 Tax=Gordonia sp. CPCC 205333 TaxID=3140790 RepID=UPI003AF3BE1A